jgi:hypothetical protein
VQHTGSRRVFGSFDLGGINSGTHGFQRDMLDRPGEQGPGCRISAGE